MYSLIASPHGTLKELSQTSLLSFIKRSSTGNEASKPKKVRGESQQPKSPKTNSPVSQMVPNANGDISSPGRSAINQSVAALKLKLSNPVKTLIRHLDVEWCYHLSKVMQSDSFSKLATFLEQERANSTIYPPADQVFSWSRLSSPEAVCVVILGQDPYHGPQQAHGLAFSVMRPTRPPPSLVNIYKEIAQDCGVTAAWPPKHGDLTPWAKQGVLLLNAVLTVRQGQPNSHKDRGWEQLTSAIVRHINDNCSHVVFMLWGANAQAQGAKLDKTRHLVLCSAHPSPLSASRGFFGCGHFSRANDYLRQHNRPPVDWSAL